LTEDPAGAFTEAVNVPLGSTVDPRAVPLADRIGDADCDADAASGIPKVLVATTMPPTMRVGMANFADEKE
jgi:hypothetical protein